MRALIARKATSGAPAVRSSAARALALALLSAALTTNAVEPDDQNRTIIGPSNVAIADGIAALRSRDADRAIELLKRGLGGVLSDREFAATLSNLCAAYLLKRNGHEALIYCNRSIEMNDRSWRAFNNRALAHLLTGNAVSARADIDRALELSPTAGQLKRTEQFYEDVVNPVEGEITIDDRQLPL